MMDNLVKYDKKCARNQLKRIGIPPSRGTEGFFGFVHFIGLKPVHCSLYDPILSTLLFFNHMHSYWDGTGLKCNRTKVGDGIPQNMFNFVGCVSYPGIFPMMFFEHISSSKKEGDILLAMQEFGYKFNHMLGKRPGPPAFKTIKYAHADTDRATSNVCCSTK